MLNKIKNFIRKIFFERKFFIKIKNKKIFSIRKFGGATAGRGDSFFSKEPETIKWINTFEKDSNFLDIGANIGIYSLYAATKNVNVVSFEPESSNFYQLNLNILDNSFQHLIKAYPFCAGIKLDIGDLDLDTLKIGGSGHTFRHKNLENSKKKNNQLFNQGSIVIDLDYFIKISNFFPNYIKIDVDGNEDQVVNGMKEILKYEKLKSILIEVDHKNKNYADIIYKITDNKFKIIEEKKNNSISNFIFLKII
jgi:FkbM family methyltransferase